MTYDYAAPSYSPKTSNNAPMRNAYAGSGYTVEANIMQWITAGASPSKMTLGVYSFATPHIPISRALTNYNVNAGSAEDAVSAESDS